MMDAQVLKTEGTTSNFSNIDRSAIVFCCERKLDDWAISFFALLIFSVLD